MFNVLIVSDDKVLTELNHTNIRKISDFNCCGSVATVHQAKKLIHNDQHSIDLILLDIDIQKNNGLSLLPILRETEKETDVIVISSIADVKRILKSLHYGVVDYLIKPYPFSRFEYALTNWNKKKKLINTSDYYSQTDVDKLLHNTQTIEKNTPQLPKGLTPQTLGTLCWWIDLHPTEEFSTDELAIAVGISRVSCRKYLLWLTQINILFTRIHYGMTGRPIYRYRLHVEKKDFLKQFCQ